MSFNNKVVMITGAGRGIGRGVALEYARKGAKVLLADIDVQAGREVEKLIRSRGGEALFCKTDVRIPEDIEKVVSIAVKEYGRLDILINNAGVSRWKNLFDITVEEWDDIVNTNLRGMFFCAREAAKVMRNTGGGSIVNISSTRSIMSEPDSEAYASSKGGILALTHALAVSLGPYGIRVNAVSPGWIELGDYDDLREVDHKQHPAGRVGKPEDIARACLYLTAEGNDFVTGTNLVIDGGMTRKMIYEP